VPARWMRKKRHAMPAVMTLRLDVKG